MSTLPASTKGGVAQLTVPVPLAPKDGVLVLSGYGLRVAVERGHLTVADGLGPERRSGRLAKATSKLRRLVVLGHSGTVSLEALRWLHDLGAAFVQLDADGEVLAATAPVGLDDPRLRRAQALASTNGVGLEIARELMRAKLRGQADVFTRLPTRDAASAVIEQAVLDLEHADTPARLRQVEAQAANAYWTAWQAIRSRKPSPPARRS